MATTARDGAEDEAGHGRAHHDTAEGEEKAARRRRNLGGGRLLGFGAGIRPRARLVDGGGGGCRRLLRLRTQRGIARALGERLRFRRGCRGAELIFRVVQQNFTHEILKIKFAFGRLFASMHPNECPFPE